MDLRLAKLKAVSFYLLHSVSTLNQCRKFSCVTVVCKSLKQRLIDVISFRLSKSINSQSVIFKRTDNFGSVFPDTVFWIVEFTRPNSRHMSIFFF
jgi:hypothetical protein